MVMLRMNLIKFATRKGHAHAMDLDTARLADQGYRLTAPRRAIVRELRAAARFCTAAELYRRVAPAGVGLASVYRTLELLASLGVAARRAEPGGEVSFLYCSSEHHHHVVCTVCGLVREIEQCPGSRLDREVELVTRFTIERHALDFFGICADCRETQEEVTE